MNPLKNKHLIEIQREPKGRMTEANLEKACFGSREMW
jgi:hypothetical protein